MIKFKIKNTEYGFDMDSRQFIVGKPHFDDRKKSEYLRGATYHPTIDGVRKKLLMMTVADEFPDIDNFTRMAEVFQENANIIDKILNERISK